MPFKMAGTGPLLGQFRVCGTIPGFVDFVAQFQGLSTPYGNLVTPFQETFMQWAEAVRLGLGDEM